MTAGSATGRIRPADLERLRGRTILVTGSAGFIGFAVARALLASGLRVVGVDNFCEPYYPRFFKDARRDALAGHAGYDLVEADLADPAAMGAVFQAHAPDLVVHLAAHASVLPSFDAPLDYVRSNIVATQVVLEEVRRSDRVQHLVYASTSSVYGKAVDDAPFEESQPTRRPISVYGASKLANEAMMQAYSVHVGLPVTGLRFFKVYGPWGRPDTVFFKFVDRVWHGLPVRLHNHGKIFHAFTYIDDVVDGTIAALARPTPPSDTVAHPVYNLGNPNSQHLGDCLARIEAALGRKAVKEYVPLPHGDRVFSRADVSRAAAALDYAVRVDVDEGIPHLVSWYRDVYAPLAEAAGHRPG